VFLEQELRDQEATENKKQVDANPTAPAEKNGEWWDVGRGVGVDVRMSEQDKKNGDRSQYIESLVSRFRE
jgi:hypothetical protein